MLKISDREKDNALSWMSAGFNIYGAYDLEKSTLPRRVFDPQKAPPGDDSPFGRLPSYMSYRPLKTTDFFLAAGDGRDSFQSQFAARASVDVSVGAFSGHVEAAYGKQVAESSSYSYANFSFREVLGILVIHGLADTKYLTDEITERIADLPDRAQPGNLDRFSDFFADFGAYFVSQIHLGATLEYYVAVQQSESMKAEQISAKMEAEYKALFVSGKATAEMSSDQTWQTYRRTKKYSLRVRGGDNNGPALTDVDTRSNDSMNQKTVDTYNKWVASIPTNSAVMDFKLTGIWEICGKKRKAVEDAFREYGRMMRPLVHIETRTVQAKGDTYVPAVFLGGTLVQATPAPAIGWGGYRMVVIDRRRPNAAGVKLSKDYAVPAGDGTSYLKIFEAMAADLKDGGYTTNDYFFVLATFGVLNSYPPSPAFVRQMQEAGAGTQLAAWLATVTHGRGTSGITGDVNYILVGIMKSGPENGVEAYRYVAMPPGSQPRVPQTTRLEVYFYSIGPGRPFVLGPAQLKSFESTPAIEAAV